MIQCSLVSMYVGIEAVSIHYKNDNRRHMHVLFLFLQSRGSTRDGTGVHDSIVNQLLTKVGEEFSVLSEHSRK